MNNNLISSHLIFLHGLSGAGKSVLQRAVEETLAANGYTPIYLSSGDCFRALSQLDPELAKKMSQGNFIQTLEGTMPLLKKTVNKFLDDLKDDKKVVLILDGFLRMAEFEVDGKTIPSQIHQVGDAFPVEEGAIIVRNAWHLYVDVNDTDAESLMRIRSEKHLGIIISKACGPSPVKSTKNEKLKGLLEKAFQIQGEEKYRLKAVPESKHKKRDEEMLKIIENIFALAGMEYKEGLAVGKAIEKITGEKVTLRDDDLTFKRRLKRINEFNVNTKNGILIKELGFKKDGENISTQQEGRKRMIKNGPSRRISLEELERECKRVARSIVNFTSSE